MISAEAHAVVFIVDDETLVRSALALAIARSGFEPRSFENARQFLESDLDTGHRPCCLILDISLPGMSGPELQDQMEAEGIVMPIIAITGESDVKSAVKMVRDGAIDLLEKPFTTEALLRLVRRALAQYGEQRRIADAHKQALQRLSLLSPREKDVLEQICAGRTTKQIASEFDIGVQTIAKHKARILDKCQVRNELQLMKFMLQDAGLNPDVDVAG